MFYWNRRARINVRVLVIVLAVTVALGSSLVVARQVRRGALFKRSLAAGEAAFEGKDWPAAAKNFGVYLRRNPNDINILRKYAEALMSVRPLDATVVNGAMVAYRRIMQLDPLDQGAYEKLGTLCTATGSFEELATVARARMGHDPNDFKATLWLADAQVGLRRKAEARQTLQELIDKLDALPGKHVEYVRACIQMSSLAGSTDANRPEAIAKGGGPSQPKTPLEWLNKAAAYAPDAVEAVVCRARLCRQMADVPGTSEQDRSSLLALARKDLEAADAMGTDNPRIRYFLGAEWMARGELDRAAAELSAVDKLPRKTLEESFFDIREWTLARFLLASELARLRGAPAEAASLADETLTSLTDKRIRVQVLPSAIPIYVMGGKVAEARRCLDEYVGILRSLEGTVESTSRLAGLQALVAGAEARPYAVIDALEPVVGSDPCRPELWRMMAQAYSQTDQPGRAVNALRQYLQFRPQDAQAMSELARQYSRMGDWSQASIAAQTAESLGSTDLVLKLLRIGVDMNLAVEQGRGMNTAKLKELSDRLAGLRQQYPDRLEIRMLQASIAEYLGHPEEAETELKLAITECKGPLRAEMQLAGYYFRTKRVNEAVSVCETACQHHPEVAEPWLSLADLHVANAAYDSARNCLKQGLNATADKRERRSVSIKLALLELVHGDRTAGTDLLKQLVAQDSQEIQARSLLLGIREIQQDQAGAEKLVSELRQAEGERGLWWRLRQASLWLSSDNWRARQQDITGLLQYCINADPMWSSPAAVLARMQERLGDFRRVEEIYRQALVSNPEAADIAGALLALLERQGRFSDAEKLLRQIQISPQMAKEWQVRIALGAGDFSRAIDELKLRASNDKQDANSRIQLARLVYQETKDAQQALRYLEDAAAIAPDSRTLTAVRASILRAEGKRAEALRSLDDYVADHNGFDAHWLRAVYLAEEGDLERAEKDYSTLTTFAQNGAAGYELLSNFYAATGRLDQGVAAVEQGLNAHPEDLRLKRRLMQLLFLRASAQDREKALELLTALEKQMPQDAELMTVRAVQMLRDATPQSIAGARERLENAVRLEPAAVNAHLALIGIALREEDYKAACDCAIRALDFNPNNPALLSARGRAELALGYAPMAVRLARQVLQKDPNSIDALSVLVDSALSTGDRNILEEARTLTESRLVRDPAKERLLIWRSSILTALARPKAAIPELEAYCQTTEGSHSVGALVTLADLYRLAGDMDQAEKKIQQAEQLGSNSQAVVHARFLWLVSQKRFADLGQISSAYVSAKEQDVPTVLRAAGILSSLDSIQLKKEGVKLFRHAVTLSPKSREACLGLASNLYQTGDVEGSKKVYQELLARYPDSPQVLNDLAWILQEHDHQYEAALEMANKGLRLASGDLHLLDTRGAILANMPDRLADAKSDFEKLVGLCPPETRQHAKALLQLGRVYAKLNEPTQAKQCLDKALEIDQKISVFTLEERSEIKKLVTSGAP